MDASVALIVACGMVGAVLSAAAGGASASGDVTCVIGTIDGASGFSCKVADETAGASCPFRGDVSFPEAEVHGLCWGIAETGAWALSGLAKSAAWTDLCKSPEPCAVFLGGGAVVVTVGAAGADDEPATVGVTLLP